MMSSAGCRCFCQFMPRGGHVIKRQVPSGMVSEMVSDSRLKPTTTAAANVALWCAQTTAPGSPHMDFSRDLTTETCMNKLRVYRIHIKKKLQRHIYVNRHMTPFAKNQRVRLPGPPSYERSVMSSYLSEGRASYPRFGVDTRVMRPT